MYAIQHLPYPGTFQFMHDNLAEIVAHDFVVRHKPFLNPYEIAAITNYIALFGTTKKNVKRFDLNGPLNCLKKLWSLAEAASPYSDNPDYEASFVLRFLYQQIPYHVHPMRVLRVWLIMGKLLSDLAVSDRLESAVGLSGGRFLTAVMRLLEKFQKGCIYPENALLKSSDSNDIKTTLTYLSADRAKRLIFHRSKLERRDPAEKPYEINSLLRFPLIKDEYQYFAPYPELIAYAGTRGLFFRLSEEQGDAFRNPFVRAFEAETAAMLRAAMPHAEVLTEGDERALGWSGKVNDVTLIVGDAAILIECKLSALFVEAKRTASPEAIVADLKKQIADGKSRRGLFQLHDKIAAIKSKALPPKLAAKYANVQRYFPVLLFFDAFEHVNAPLTIGNMIKDELSAHGVTNLPYQLWHLEELSWLTEFAGSSLVDWVAEKFSPGHYELGLNTFIGKKRNMPFLQPPMYMPRDDHAYAILKRLSDMEAQALGHDGT